MMKDLSLRIQLGMISVIVILAGCLPGFPEPDCGGIQNVEIFGTVHSEDTRPITGAIVSIRSQRQNACTGSQPMHDLTLVSDDSGLFRGVIPLIYADDVILIEVSAEGFRTRSYESRTYTFFDHEVVVTLRKAS